MRRILFVLLLITITVISACGKEDDKKDKNLKIAVALPMDQGWAMPTLQGIQLALQGHDNIELVTYDTAGYDVDLEIQAAQQAIADPDVVAYIGMGGSGQARAILPLLNEANLAAISLTATAPGLTKPGFGENEPGIYYPTGRRNFFRMVPSDEVQGRAAAYWADERASRIVYLVDDGSFYGTTVTGVFEVTAQEVSISIVGHEHFDPETATDETYAELAAQIIEASPTMVYIGAYADGGASDLIAALRQIDPALMIMGTDGIVLADYVITDVGAEPAEGVYATDVVPPPQQVATAADFVTAYEAAYNMTPITNSMTGYEAMNALLYVIDHTADPSRNNVIRGLSSMEDFSGAMGRWNFDVNGDISTNAISVWQIQSGQWVFVEIAD